MVEEAGVPGENHWPWSIWPNSFIEDIDVCRWRTQSDDNFS
jgi:hypothetical protein